MIRTNVVTLSVIRGIAFRQKLTSGGSGVTILRYDCPQPGIAAISKTSGEPIPSDNTPLKLFPIAAFKEAIELTNGMPYRKQRNVRLDKEMLKELMDDPANEPPLPEEVVVDSADYQKVVEAYTDKEGKLSYDLINKDLIQFGFKSAKVSELLSSGASQDEILNYIVGYKYRTITENPDLTDAQIAKISELLEEVSPKGVYKELKGEIRRWQSANQLY